MKNRRTNLKKGKIVGGEANLIKMLQSAAKKFGLSNLSGRLDGVRLENGKINVVNRKNGNKLKFNQKKCSYLCDVTLKSSDGKEFPCHKCVLCARLGMCVHIHLYIICNVCLFLTGFLLDLELKCLSLQIIFTAC